MLDEETLNFICTKVPSSVDDEEANLFLEGSSNSFNFSFSDLASDNELRSFAALVDSKEDIEEIIQESNEILLENSFSKSLDLLDFSFENGHSEASNSEECDSKMELDENDHTSGSTSSCQSPQKKLITSSALEAAMKKLDDCMSRTASSRSWIHKSVPSLRQALQNVDHQVVKFLPSTPSLTTRASTPSLTTRAEPNQVSVPVSSASLEKVSAGSTKNQLQEKPTNIRKAIPTIKNSSVFMPTTKTKVTTRKIKVVRRMSLRSTGVNRTKVLASTSKHGISSFLKKGTANYKGKNHKDLLMQASLLSHRSKLSGGLRPLPYDSCAVLASRSGLVCGQLAGAPRNSVSNFLRHSKKGLLPRKHTQSIWCL